MSRFTVIVNQAPFEKQSNYTALRFCRAIIESEHCLTSVFFYQAAVNSANAFLMGHSDEISLSAEWQQLSNDYSVPLLVCVSAANRRGVISQEDAVEADSAQFNLHPSFIASGLGELAELMAGSDRVVQF
jgi:tRNA 2-thiouridine synthesizing protein D